MVVLFSVLCPIVLATWPVKWRGGGVWERKMPFLLSGKKRSLLAFSGALHFSEPAGPISRPNRMQIKQSLWALAVQSSICSVSHCARSNGLPCKLLSSVCVFFFLSDDSSQVKGHFSSDKTFLLLSEFCVCFSGKAHCSLSIVCYGTFSIFVLWGQPGSLGGS